MNYKEFLLVCQKDNIVNNAEAFYVCCDFTKSPLKCDYNYMTVKYKEKVEYTSGFINDNNPYRNLVYFIIDQDSIIQSKDPLTIEKDNSIDIFMQNILTLENFFDKNYDTNVENIISVDLSHINSTKLSSTHRMFQDCSSIKEIIYI